MKTKIERWGELAELGTRIANVCNIAGIYTREDVRNAIRDGRLCVGKNRNYGHKSHETVLGWLGITPKKETRWSRMAETIITTCIPSGDNCDPQQVADSIREYFRSL